MSGLPTTGTPNAGNPVVQTPNKETLVLLNEFASLGFMLHTHHPMTHVAVAPEVGVNVRQECGQDRVPVVASA